jgi:hypothetical protein
MFIFCGKVGNPQQVLGRHILMAQLSARTGLDDGRFINVSRPVAWYSCRIYTSK